MRLGKIGPSDNDLFKKEADSVVDELIHHSIEKVDEPIEKPEGKQDQEMTLSENSLTYRSLEEEDHEQLESQRQNYIERMM